MSPPMASMRRAISTGETRRRPTSYLALWALGHSTAAPLKALPGARCVAAPSGRDVVLAWGRSEGAVQCETACALAGLRVLDACGHAVREVQQSEPGEAQGWRASSESVGPALLRDEFPLTPWALASPLIRSCRPARPRSGPAQSVAPLRRPPNAPRPEDQHVVPARALDDHLRGRGAHLAGAWRLCAGAGRWVARRCREPRRAPRSRRRSYRWHDRCRGVAPTARPADPARREIWVRARPCRPLSSPTAG